MASKKPTPAPAAEPTKAPSRSELLATLKDAGYAGPTSFTVTTLREVVACVEAGSPRDGKVPTGVLFSVHPDLRPAPKSKPARLTKHEQGYQQAVAEVAGLGVLASVQKWVEDNRVAVA